MKVYLSGPNPGDPETIEAHVSNCPFCNQEPTGIKMADGFHMILCCDGHEIVIGGETAEAAIAAWNTRAPHTCTWRDDGEYWESACELSWWLVDGTPAENNMNYCPKCGGRVVVEEVLEL